MRNGRAIGLSLLAVGTAAVAGYVLRSGRSRASIARVEASIGARTVEDVPSTATVVDVSSDRLRDIPGAKRAIERAVDASADDGWVEVTFADRDAWSVVDSLRGALPYYDGCAGEYNGVYVRADDRFVVVDAVGWAELEGQTV
nr:hypothetical protein [Halovivax limisalsi]